MISDSFDYIDKIDKIILKIKNIIRNKKIMNM